MTSTEESTVDRMRRLSQKLVSLAANQPDETKQEYEELLLATTSKCKSTLSSLRASQAKVGQVGAVLALTEKLTTQIDQCEQIESENQDCDEAGICRTIDSITGSRKLRDGTREQLDKFKAVQRDTNAILAQARALIADPKHMTPAWFNQRVAECETIMSQLGESLEQRMVFLDDNLSAWILFEETCDEINGHLDQVENENKIELKLDTLQKVEYRLDDLRKNRDNMVSSNFYNFISPQKIIANFFFAFAHSDSFCTSQGRRLSSFSNGVVPVKSIKLVFLICNFTCMRLRFFRVDNKLVSGPFSGRASPKSCQTLTHVKDYKVF